MVMQFSLNKNCSKDFFFKLEQICSFVCTLHYAHVVSIKLFSKTYLPEDMPK